MNDQQYISIPYMPDGKPCPAIMTGAEVIEFLRLDGHNESCLKYYRDQGLLIGVRIGKRVRYPLSEVLKFIERKVNKK